MASKVSLFIFFCSTLLLLTGAQERAPHGLVYESPVAFSPSAVEFFHPKAQQPDKKNPCASSSSCSPLPLAAQVQAAEAQESEEVVTSQKGGSRLGAGGIVAIVFGLAFAVLLAMGAYYVLITRRANLSRANSDQPIA